MERPVEVGPADAQRSGGSRVGVSACLLGCPVRYDGRSRDVADALVREFPGAAFTPVCPECMAGLGVPRPRIRLTGSGEDVVAGVARAVDEDGRDVTEALLAGARACVATLDLAGVEVVVLKEGSPSCGLLEAPVADRLGERAAGVFAAMVCASGRRALTERAIGGGDPSGRPPLGP